jgi:hypothetical protein
MEVVEELCWPSPEFGKTFKHVKVDCVDTGKDLNTAHSLWLKSLQICPEAADVTCLAHLESLSKSSSEDALQVLLLLNVENGSLSSSLALTSCSLQITIDNSCFKTFAFAKKDLVRIPLSTRRPTSLTIQAHREGEKLPLQHFICRRSEKNLTTTDENFLVEKHTMLDLVGVALDIDNKWTFQCFEYERDITPNFNPIYTMEQFANDLKFLHKTFQPVPSKNIATVNTSIALKLMARLETDRAQLLEAIKSCRLQTVERELGATAENAQEMVKNIDWTKSYCIASDEHIPSVISLSRAIHRNLNDASNVCVACQLPPPLEKVDVTTNAAVSTYLTGLDLQQNMLQSVSGLLCERKKIAEYVAQRRLNLESVIQMRTNFIVLSAIDDCLRSVCGMTKTCDGTLSSDNVSCYTYWLGQMKSNTNNSLVMTDKCYNEAMEVISACQKIKNCATLSIVPECSTKLSAFTRDIWNNMHLQGLATRHKLVVASVPHFLYRQQKMLNYDNHPLMCHLKKNTNPTEEQFQSAKLLATLISADVEHRIIPAFTHDLIITKFASACQKNTTESTEALKTLFDLFHESLHSLISCAAGHFGKTPDISFVSKADTRKPQTGYNNNTLLLWTSNQIQENFTK